MRALFVIAACAGGYFFGPVGAAAALGAALLWLIARALTARSAGGAGDTDWSSLTIQSETELAPPPEPVESPPSSERFYDGTLPWVLLAVVTRVALVLVLNMTSLWRSFAPDALGWDSYGRQMLDYWLGVTAYPEPWLLEVNGRWMYASLTAVSAALFDSTRYPMSFVNAGVGILAAWVMGRLAEEVYDARVGRRTFLLAMFFPSMMTWTCMSIREAYAYLTLATLLLAVQKLRSRLSLVAMVLLLVCLPTLYTIRSYLVPLTLAGVMLSLVIVRFRQLPYALAALLFLGGLIAAFGDDLGISTELASEEQLEELHQLRNGLAFGGSAYGADVDTRTVAGTLAYLPEGLARFLFAPFPWAIRSWRQAATLPESLLWLLLFSQAARAIWRDARQNLAAIATPLFVVILVTIAYAIVSGNEGTAYRHRAQIMLVLFMFSAAHQVRRSGLADRARQVGPMRPPNLHVPAPTLRGHERGVEA